MRWGLRQKCRAFFNPLRTPEQIVDEAMERYVTWRERAAAVRTAYDAFARAETRIERSVAFDAFDAVLDDEERAAEEFASFVGDAASVL